MNLLLEWPPPSTETLLALLALAFVLVLWLWARIVQRMVERLEANQNVAEQLARVAEAISVLAGKSPATPSGLPRFREPREGEREELPLPLGRTLLRR